MSDSTKTDRVSDAHHSTAIGSNWLKRMIFGLVLIAFFALIISLGPIAILLLGLSIQILCFNEIIAIGYRYNQIPQLPHFRSICWYFLIATNYFCYNETFVYYFSTFNKWYLPTFHTNYHRFFSFCLYFGGIIIFVLSLVKKHDLKQFRLLAWTHTLLIIIVIQSYTIIQNIFQGLIWLILPAMMVILNDSFAYFFGKIWGKTPLIQLSPNKTWEGFIGGGLCTIISSFLLSDFLCQFKHMVCPVIYRTTPNGLELFDDCTPDLMFAPVVYSWGGFSVRLYPFMKHALVFALFASVVAPFAGFCASGFKRAFKIKDFGDMIPGHGGMMDRFDCQYLMAPFVNVYIFTFIKNPTITMIHERFLKLPDEDQQEFVRLLEYSLKLHGLLK